ncbi:MAG: hypothetical protein U9R05_10540 [Chloroflexota bacterium]|nr:hypothetical protein [Chloroflexota bacterium]
MTNDRATDKPEKADGIVQPDAGATLIPSGDRATLDSRAHHAFELIAGDAALTGALTDEAAQVLLDWALDETQQLVAATQEMEECAAQAALAPKIRRLRCYLREIARNSADEDNPTGALRALLTPHTYPEP